MNQNLNGLNTQNNNFTVEQWFPKPIYFKDNFALDESAVLKKWLEQFFVDNKNLRRTPELNVASSHGLFNFLDEKIFNTFLSKILDSVLEFANFLGYGFSLNDLEFMNVWSNKSVTGEYLYPHVHSGSFISGAYYVDCENTNDTIKFYDNLQKMIYSSPNPNSYSFEDCSYPCLPNRLILFKSDLLHGCPALIGKEKTVISFNVKIK
jgi:uncharacterized protein (TIGR02466 family)